MADNLTYMRVWFKDGNKRTFKSYPRIDEKHGKRAGMNQLRKYVAKENILQNVQSAIIYCAVSGNEEERVVINGKKLAY